MPPSTIREAATDTRARILAEAERLFAEKDFSGTGIGEIARRAGIAKSVIYHHFRGKDDILRTLIDDFVDAAVALNRRLPEKHGIRPDDPMSASIDAVEGCMREMIDFLGSRKWMLKIILLQSVKDGPDVPLFDVIRKFQRSADECCGARAGSTAAKLADIQVADFFMNFLPIVSFLVFQEKWCDHVGMEEERAKRKFVDTYVRYTRQVYWPLVMKGASDE